MIKQELKLTRGKNHGYHKDSIYRRWKDMRRRVYDENNKGYEYYGSRGIVICNEWRNDPVAFIDWALKNGYKEGLYIDRINNNGDYEPNNCRFVTPSQSSYNTRLLRKDNTSGYRGVSFNKIMKKWYSRISIKNERRHLGCFNSKIQAALRYDAEAYMLNDNRPMNFMINHKR